MKHTFSLLFMILLSFQTISSARELSAIALTVDGYPVTTQEIRQTQRKLGISRQQAIDLLIQDRLQKEAMKDITISDEEVDREITNIAKANRLKVSQLRHILQQQGTSWQQYRNSIRTMLKQRRFFQEKVAPSMPRPSEKELKRYYDTHKTAFTMPSSFKVIEYQASDANALEALTKGNPSKIKKVVKTLKTKMLTPALLEQLLRIPEGSVSKPIDTGNGYVAYKILSKKGSVLMPFDIAQERVFMHWMAQRRERALKDYFQKMRTQADIRYLRK